MRPILLFSFIFYINALSAQTNAAADRFAVTTEGDGPDRVWLIRHAGSAHVAPQRIVVFLHGWGATNPGAYGGWIEHLLGDAENGSDRLVIFPKFQCGLWPPKGEVFTRRVQRRLETILANLRVEYPGMTTEVTLVGHSIGSVIAANLADRQAELLHFRINGLLLSTPGHKLFSCGRQKSYARICSDLPVIIITAENDGASGEKFARHFVAQSPQLQRRVYLQQPADTHDDEVVDAKHRTPVSPLPELYQPDWNLINAGAKWLCTTNRADEACYFRLTDALLLCAESGDCAGLDVQDPRTLQLGQFADGMAVRALRVME